LAVWIVLTLVYEVAVSDWIFAGFGVSLAVAIWVVASYLRERRVSFAESVSNDGAKR
jgi:type IV secretory pathway TrbD component